jgi:tripartite-type tricarboxylate transporter receptor subunit TctC
MFGRLFACVAAVALVLSSSAVWADNAYPTRPIKLVVPWGAGGGTDAVARMLATLLERDLGKPVNVVNITGGSGVMGHQSIATAAPDGYTIGLVTTEITMMHHQGLTQLSGASFTPLGMVNLDPAAVQVRADSPYRSLQELVAAIKANPGKLKGSGTARGGSWHLSLYGMLKDAGVDPTTVPWVPSVSNNAALLDLAAGGVDIVAGSLAEARALIEAGKIRSLAIMDDKPSPLFPQVPTLQAAIGSKWKSGVWRGLVAPKGIPKSVEARLVAATKAAYESAEFRQFMQGRGFGMVWMGPEEFGTFMARADAESGALMKATGLAK